MTNAIPDPHTLHPVPAFPRVVFLRPPVKDPRITVGEYTYYDDPDAADEFETRNVPYAYGPERLGGNPAKPVKRRFDAAGTALMLDAAWWDWPVAVVTEHARTIMSGTPADIAAIAESLRAKGIV